MVALSLKIVGAITALGAQLFLAWLLGAQQFGEYVLVQSWLVMAVVLVKGGWEGASARFVAEYNATGQQGLLAGFFRARRQMVGLAALVTAASAAIGLSLLQDYLSPTLVASCWWMIAIVPLSVAADLFSVDLRARQKILWADAPLLVAKPLGTLLLVAQLVMVARWPATSSTVVLSLGLTIFSILIVYGLRLATSQRCLQAVPTRDDHRLWWSTALPLFWAAVSQFAMAQTDCITMGIFWSATDTGIYAAASRMANVIPLGVLAINAVGAPLIAEQFALNRQRDLQRVASHMAGGALLMTAPAVVGAVVLGRHVLSYFGPEFEQGYIPLVILSVGQLVNALAGSVGQVLAMTGRQKLLARLMALSALGQVLLTFFLVPLYGMLGAAVATTVGRIAWNVALVIVVWQVTGVNTTLLPFRRPVYQRT